MKNQPITFQVQLQHFDEANTMLESHINNLSLIYLAQFKELRTRYELHKGEMMSMYARSGASKIKINEDECCL